ncbi:MAG: hypothetical protein Q9217_003955 [Psora testacea]
MSRRKRQRLTEAAHGLVTAASDEDATTQDTDFKITLHDKQIKPQTRRSLFVRSLPASATTESLTHFFSQSYPLKHATVVVDKATQLSKKFGFVTFASVEDAENAEKEFNGASFSGSKIKVEIAEPRRRQQTGDKSEPPVSTARAFRDRQNQSPPKLIVRNLPWTIKSEEQLGNLFMSYGKIKHVKIPKKEAGLSAGYGFVVLRGHKNAERALEAMNGKVIDGRTLAIDWAVEKEVWEKLQQEDAKQGFSDETDRRVKSQEKAEVDITGLPPSDRGYNEGLDSGCDEESMDEENEEVGVDGIKHTGATNNESTLFVRNIPFTVTEQILFEHFASFGPVRYARVVIDPATERSKGTGFVCFYNMDDAETCLRESPNCRNTPNLQRATGRGSNATTSLKQSVLEDTTVDRTGRFTLEGRVLHVSGAVDRMEAARLAFVNTNLRDARDRDRRHLYLLSEGTVPSNSPLYEKISPSEIKMRQDSAKQRANLIRSNPSLHLSLTRLSIRNIPRFITSKDLKSLAREAVVGFAGDVRAGSREHLSKEEVSRGGEEMKLAEKNRKAKGKGIVKQAKIVFEGRDGGKVAEDSGAGRSRGYGFVEYSSHRWALMGLRWLNGHVVDPPKSTSDSIAPMSVVNERKKRLIVEFAIENAQVVLRRQQREYKAQERSKLVSEQREKGKLSGKERQWTKDQSMAKTGERTKRKRLSESRCTDPSEDGILSQNPKEAEKVAKRQKIIGRKRMSRKARHQTKGD